MTVYLASNDIGSCGAEDLAKHLQGPQVHTVYLGDNDVEDSGAVAFASNLPGTQVYTVNLSFNYKIGTKTKKLLKENYPHISWIF